MEWIVEFVSEWFNGSNGRMLSGGDDDDPYAVLKGDLFNGADSPEAWRIIVTTLLILTFGSLAAGAGVGGGGLFVPIYAILLGVGGKPAVPLSKCTILGAAIGNYVDIGWARHPHAERPLIDYEVSTFMQSGELLGVTLGVLLNLMLPEVVIMVFLALLLSFNAYKTINKGMAKYKKETDTFAKQAKMSLQESKEEEKSEGQSFKMHPVMTPVNTTSDIERHHREQLDMIQAAGVDLAQFLDQESLGHTLTKLQQYGIDTITDLDDSHIVSDSILMSEIGMSEAEVGTLRAALTVRREEMESALQPDFDAAFDVTLGPDDAEEPTALSTDVSEGIEMGSLEKSKMSSESAVNNRSAELQKLYDDASIQFPIWAYVIVVGMTVYTVVYAVIKKEWLNPCIGAEGFWLWQFTPVPILGLCMLQIGKRLNKMHQAREAAGYQYLETDIKFTQEQLLKFPVTAVNAGLAAGLLGIGGGMVIGPLFIEIGMQPQVGTSSCAYMILWTAMSGVIQYYLAGKLGWQFMIFFASFGFLSGQLGQKGVNGVLKRTGRPSIVVLLLGGIIGLACCVMTISTLVDISGSHQTSAEMFRLELDWSKCSYWLHHA